MANFEKELVYLRYCVDHLISRTSSYYYGAILSHLKWIPVTNRGEHFEFSVSADGELLFNPNIPSIQKKDTLRTCRDLLHEASHIAFEHHPRMEFMGLKTQQEFGWANVAADCSIEAILDKDFPGLPGDPVHHTTLAEYVPRPQWDGSSMEALYQLVAQSGKDAEPKDMEALSDKGKQAIRGAMQQAEKQTLEHIENSLEQQAATNTKDEPKPDEGLGGLGIGNDAAVKGLLNLQRYEKHEFTSLNSIAKLFTKTYGRGEDKDDSVFNQRHLLRRNFMGMPLIGRHQRLTSEKDGEVQAWHNDITCFCDVSGSMNSNAIRNSFKLLMRFAKQYGVDPITAYTYNRDIVQKFVITRNTDIDKMDIKIGGGTSVGHCIERINPQSKLVFILTDMLDSPFEWKYPGKQIWLIHDNRHTEHERFGGERIYINDIIGKQ